MKRNDRPGHLYLLIHVEFQSQRDDQLPLRMFVYQSRIFDAHGQHPVGLAVLGDTEPAWRPTVYEWRQAGTHGFYQFEMVKLWDWRDRIPELEALDSPIGLIVVAHLQSHLTAGDDAQRYAWKRRLFRMLYNRGYGPEEIRQVYAIIDWFLNLPPESERQIDVEVATLEREKAMPLVTSIERRARQEGREEEGLKVRRSWVRITLGNKYGEAGEQFAQDELADADADTLDKVVNASAHTATVNDLRAFLKS